MSEADTHPRSPEVVGLLEGITVLDFTQYLSGPLTSMVLGFLGADVIKVEPLTGDGSREQPPFVGPDGEGDLYGSRLAENHMGLAFLKRNVGKRSIAIDLKSDAGRLIIQRLVKRSDVVLHNFRPGVVERLGIDEASIRAINPEAIYLEISGLGSYDHSWRGGVVDVVGQAMSGAMGITGMPDGPPVRSAVPIADQVAGLFGAIGVLAALLGKNLQGTPSGAVRVSMLQALGFLVWDEHLDTYAEAGLPARNGNRTHRNAPFDAYRCSDDRYVAIAAIGRGEWLRLRNATGILQFQDPELESLSGRLSARLLIDALLSEWTARRTRDEVVDILEGHGCTVAPVYEPIDLLRDDRYRRAVLIDVLHPDGPVHAVRGRMPLNWSAQPSEEARSAPRLGADTRDVLAVVAGFTAEEIVALEREGVVNTHV